LPAERALVLALDGEVGAGPLRVGERLGRLLLPDRRHDRRGADDQRQDGPTPPVPHGVCPRRTGRLIRGHYRGRTPPQQQLGWRGWLRHRSAGTLCAGGENMRVVPAIEKLFRERGSAAYLGEAVSQLEHALQAAAAAERDPAPPALVAAALLHDVGHLLHTLGEDAADRGLDD